MPIQQGVLPPNRRSIMIPMNDELIKFRHFCTTSWKDSLDLVEKACKKQVERNPKKR